MTADVALAQAKIVENSFNGERLPTTESPSSFKPRNPTSLEHRRVDLTG